jgi:RHS repeat-associated protein
LSYYHVDHLGSTRLKTDAVGGIVYVSNYEPFGVGCGEDGGEDYRYTGKHEDTTGLYYFGARYYDPTTGRFITRDTVFGKLTDPQSQNRYVYCLNNPNKYVDLDGKIALQIGVDYSIGAGWGFSGSGGLIITHGKAEGWDIGIYGSSGTGGFIGGGGGLGLEIVITPSTNTIEDAKGESLDITIEGAKGPFRGGAGVSIPIINKDTGELDSNINNYGIIINPAIGAGIEAGIAIQKTKTYAYSYSDINELISERLSWLNSTPEPYQKSDIPLE